MNTPNAQTLRPGLLVSLSTSVRGNITYQTQTIENRRVDDLGQERARWETTRVIADPAEHDEAIKVRSRVRSLITGVCSTSAFGLLCPEVNAQKLTEAIAAARELTDDFNARATITRMHVNVICGRIAADDVEAVKAITGEVRSLMEDMQEGLKSLDVKAVRDACNKARDVGAMLTPDAQERLSGAIDAARSAARRIVKAGEVIGLEIDAAAIARIDSARTAFLDLDADTAAVAVPEMDGRGIDFMPAPDPATAVDLPAPDEAWQGRCDTCGGSAGPGPCPHPVLDEDVPLKLSEAIAAARALTDDLTDAEQNEVAQGIRNGDFRPTGVSAASARAIDWEF